MTSRGSIVMTRRLWWLIALLLSVFCLLWWRLLDVQLRQGPSFAERAQQNRYFFKKHQVERGVILDRFNQPLVENQQNYYRLLSPDQLYSAQQLLNQDEALQWLATASGQLSSDFSRIYPYKASLAHILGYLSALTAEDLLVDPNLAFDEQLGRMGLEKSYEQLLKSRAGQDIYEVNALGEKQQLISQQTASRGQNLATSLDPYLSMVVAQEMEGLTGAVVIMDAQTGQILSLFSSPSFDPNLFEQLRLAKLNQTDQVLDKKAQLTELLTSEQQVFFNRAISGTYPLVQFLS